MNGPCKRFLKASYLAYQMREIERKRDLGIQGRLVVKINRGQLITWVENFVDDFNNIELKGLTNIILPCLSKVRPNCFSDENNTFETWLGSLTKNALYKSLLDAHTAVKL